MLDIQTGDEKAVAGTKAYTSQLMTIAMLSVAMSGEEERWNELNLLSGWAQKTLEHEQRITQAAQRYRYIQ